MFRNLWTEMYICKALKAPAPRLNYSSGRQAGLVKVHASLRPKLRLQY